MFIPKYNITNKLLKNIKQIYGLVGELNQKRFPRVVLVEMQKSAEAVSAHASTSIEGNPLPLTDVKVLLKTKPKNLRDSEQEVINYNKVLQEINSKLRKGKIQINLPLILDIQKKISDKLLPEFQSGKLRNQPVFVNDPRVHKTIYWPPDVQDVSLLMQDQVEFVQKNRQVIDPLILAGILHKQIVIIHPFMDGNGRAARLLTKILLAEMGLNTFNLFSFENYYNNNVTRYFGMVGVRGNYYDVVGDIDFTLWLEYFTDGIIDELLRVSKFLPRLSISPQTELKSYHKKILEFIRQKGFITNRAYAKIVKRARATRYLDFKKLINLDLIQMKDKSKNTFYVLKEK